MTGGARILVVEDEPRLGELVRLYLEREGYRPRVVTDGRDAIAALDAEAVDLVVLDLMLPGLSGEEVLARIREEGEIPVLITSAKRSDAERIAGLRMGADDYLAKPFNPHELTARVAAILRRSRPNVAGGEPSGPVISLGAGRLVVDPGSRRFVLARAASVALGARRGRAAGLPGAPIDQPRDVAGGGGQRGVRRGRLTRAEFGLLAALARRPGAVLTREQLLEAVTRRPDEVFDRVVDVHVANLRRKLDDDPAAPWLIETVPQTGYRLATGRDPG